MSDASLPGALWALHDKTEGCGLESIATTILAPLFSIRHPPPLAVVAPGLGHGAGQLLQHLAARFGAEHTVVAAVDRRVALPAEGRHTVHRRAALVALQLIDLIGVAGCGRDPFAGCWRCGQVAIARLKPGEPL